MELGLERNKVKLVPYNKNWKNEFEKVKEIIHNSTGIENDKIEHIGSTAIKNIMAKPLIDILVGVENISCIKPDLIKQLKQIGFYKLKVERKNEIVFAKFTDDTFNIKTHFIHLVDYDGEIWKNLIFFRDYLNYDESSREDYENIKKKFVEIQSVGIEEYTDSKEEFVKYIFSKRT